MKGMRLPEIFDGHMRTTQGVLDRTQVVQRHRLGDCLAMESRHIDGRLIPLRRLIIPTQITVDGRDTIVGPQLALHIPGSHEQLSSTLILRQCGFCLAVPPVGPGQANIGPSLMAVV